MTTTNPNRFYIYEHWRPDKNECFYVGKGSQYRSGFIVGRKNAHHRNIVEHLTRIGLEVQVRIVKADLDEESAFSLEREQIAYWRGLGVKLANRTDGGEGFCGGRHSAEVRRRMGHARRGKKRPPEVVLKIKAALTGRVRSLESRLKMSEGQKRRHANNPEHLKSISKLGTIAQYGVRA